MNTHFFVIRNSFIRNFTGTAKLVRNFQYSSHKGPGFFFHFQYHNFEDTVANFDKDMFRKASFCGTNSYS